MRSAVPRIWLAFSIMGGAIAHATEPTQQQALDIVETLIGGNCYSGDPCTYRAVRKDNLWYVQVYESDVYIGPHLGGCNTYVVDDEGNIREIFPYC